MLFLARDGMRGQLIETETQTVMRNYALGEVARNALVYSPASQSVIAHQSRNCALFLSASTQQPLQRSFTPELVTSCAVTSCGTFMVAGTVNGTVLLWNLISGELIKNYKGHLRAIQCVAISSDDSLVATASEDSVCKVWNLSTLASLRMREVVPRCIFTGHSLSVNCCAFMRLSRVLVTGSSDRTCRLIDARSGEQLHAIAVGDAVTALAVSDDDRSLVAGTQKGFLHFSELYTAAYGLPVVEGEGGREAILRPPSPDGHHSPVVFLQVDAVRPSLVLTASEGGAVLWYDMHSGPASEGVRGAAEGAAAELLLCPLDRPPREGCVRASRQEPSGPDDGELPRHAALRRVARGEAFGQAAERGGRRGGGEDAGAGGQEGGAAGASRTFAAAAGEDERHEHELRRRIGHGALAKSRLGALLAACLLSFSFSWVWWAW